MNFVGKITRINIICQQESKLLKVCLAISGSGYTLKALHRKAKFGPILTAVTFLIPLEFAGLVYGPQSLYLRGGAGG